MMPWVSAWYALTCCGSDEVGDGIRRSAVTVLVALFQPDIEKRGPSLVLAVTSTLALRSVPINAGWPGPCSGRGYGTKRASSELLLAIHGGLRHAE